MRLLAPARRAVKRLALGPEDFPQQCILGMRDPQQEIVVELHGRGRARDVTQQHTLACAAPFTVCIGLEQELDTTAPFFLHFRERTGTRRLLGELRLQVSMGLELDGRSACCFTVSGCRNHCIPLARLWARYLHWAYLRWRRPPDVRLASIDIRAMPIFFICPRPVALVTAGDSTTGNIFPMNLMGPLGGGLFGFALNSARSASALVKRSPKLAVSSVPIDRAGLARELGRNHKADCSPWDRLPFETVESPILRLPVPSFSPFVREMEVFTSRELGSHTFFVARILHDQYRADDLQFFMVHGIYQAWRQKEHPDRAATALEPAI